VKGAEAAAVCYNCSNKRERWVGGATPCCSYSNKTEREGEILGEGGGGEQQHVASAARCKRKGEAAVANAAMKKDMRRGQE